MADAPERMRFREGLLAAAAALGLAAALYAALGGPALRAPAGAAALVGDRTITEEDLARALSALEADKRAPLTPQDRAFALERLIEEELLVQRGLELGLARDDPAARKALAQAMVEFAALQASARSPSEKELRAFHAGRPRLFASAPSLKLKAALVANTDAATAAFLAKAAAAGFDAAAADGAPAPLPPVWLGPEDIAQLIGPSAAAAALAAAPGAVAGPVRLGPHAAFVLVTERREGEIAGFDDVRPAVEAAWRRHAEEEALSAYLADLKRRARIVRAGTDP